MSHLAGKEVLIHNLSHADLILGVNVDGISETIVARPKFSQFNAISQQLYQSILESNELKLLQCEGFEKRGSTSVRNIYIGFELTPHIQFEWDLDKLRFRDDDKSKMSGFEGQAKSCLVSYIYFPLFSVLLRQWTHTIHDHAHDDFRKVIVLVSGRGEPIDSKAQDLDNSTEFTGKLIQLFIQQLQPDIEVHLLHSTTNLFRYDANIAFVKQELLPKIIELREELLDEDEPKWKDKLKLTLSFADGSTARISAINASLKHFRPSYMHFWVLKTFWREKKIYFDDVEFHTFEEISTEIATEIADNHDPLVARAIEEMMLFRQKITESLEMKNDLANFWLRKTKKLVLAVLIVEKNGQVKAYSGTNMEVSMPTGSLCAERNVIGSALADDITLTRKDIKVVAVYSYPKIEKPSTSSNTSPGFPLASPLLSQGDREGGEPAFKKLKVETNGQLAYNNKDHIPMEMISTPKSPSGPKRKIMKAMSSDAAPASQTSPGIKLPTYSPEPGHLTRKSPRLNAKRDSLSSTKTKSVLFATPFAERESSSVDYVETVLPFCTTNPLQAAFKSINVELGDLNPIKPCGACNEWLKKIAEVNPNMKVVTFTDAACEGIYVENIAE